MGTRATDASAQKVNCTGCGQHYDPACDWRQGRCPQHPPLVSTATVRKILLLLAAPVIIVAWTITHPRQLWQQIRQDWNL